MMPGMATVAEPPVAQRAASARDGLPPGPRTPGALQSLAMVTRPLGFVRACRRRHGPTFTVTFAPFGKVVYLTDPDDVKAAFTGDPATFHTGEARESLAPILGQRSLLLLDEDTHLRERKLMLPPFHGERLRGYEAAMAEITAEEATRIPRGRPFALRPHMQAITLEVILRVVVGTREPERLAPLRAALGRLMGIHPAWIVAAAWTGRDLGPGSPYRRIIRRRDTADELIYAEIARRRERPGGEDMLSMLLEARDEDGEGLDDQALRDELVTLLLAGHETTATGLAWAFERLVRNPEAMARARAAAAGDDDAYLDAVVKEVLRVRPVVTDVARQLMRPAELAGWRLPTGTIVMSSVSAIQLSGEHWPDPTAFRPERFLDGGAPEPYTWIPFGGGVKRCIGASFAMVEMRVVLRELLRRLRFEPVRPEPERGRVRHVTFAPQHDCELRAL
ncbi:MAG: cytochrome family [Solirubrobacteraceae bacterium]|jgi:cytochrome P450|nr:cytochrome family [Solirubrobacteraceae bacterium]